MPHLDNGTSTVIALKGVGQCGRLSSSQFVSRLASAEPEPGFLRESDPVIRPPTNDAADVPSQHRFGPKSINKPNARTNVVTLINPKLLTQCRNIRSSVLAVDYRNHLTLCLTRATARLSLCLDEPLLRLALPRGSLSCTPLRMLRRPTLW